MAALEHSAACCDRDRRAESSERSGMTIIGHGRATASLNGHADAQRRFEVCVTALRSLRWEERRRFESRRGDVLTYRVRVRTERDDYSGVVLSLQSVRIRRRGNEPDAAAIHRAVRVVAEASAALVWSVQATGLAVAADPVPTEVIGVV
jgi:hypothetical protein